MEPGAGVCTPEAEAASSVVLLCAGASERAMCEQEHESPLVAAYWVGARKHLWVKSEGSDLSLGQGLGADSASQRQQTQDLT